MIEVTFSNSFKKSFQKKIKNNLPLKKKFWEKVEIFIAENEKAVFIDIGTHDEVIK